MSEKKATASDVHEAAERLAVVAERLGLKNAEWEILPGSVANGRPWRLFEADGSGYKAVPWLNNGFLGKTIVDAVNVLDIYRRAWDVVATGTVENG